MFVLQLKNMHMVKLFRGKELNLHIGFPSFNQDTKMIEFSLKFYRTKFNGEHNHTLW